MQINKENLNPNGTIDSSELASALGKKGGKRSGEARRERRKMRDTLEYLLNLPLGRGKGAEMEAIKSFQGATGINLTVEQAMLLAQIKKALCGDTSAFLAVRDTSGNKPTDEIQINSVPCFIDDV